MRADQDRVNNLVQYVRGLINKESGKELYLKYKSYIEQVTPQEVFEIFYAQLKNGMEPKEILTILDKVINVFYKSLSGYSWKKPEPNSFMGYLMQENNGLKNKLEKIKEIIKEKSFQVKSEELLSEIREPSKFNEHYLKLENILFPYMEKKMEKFNGLAIMWALHDEARKYLKETVKCLEDENCKEAEFNTIVGALFFAMYGLAQKEELILFPAASEIIEENEWIDMHRQSLDYEFPFINKTKKEIKEEIKKEMKENDILIGVKEFIKDLNDSKESLVFKTETGALSFEQLLMIFDVLPVDLTFVDENNKVRFFTRPKDRIFPRSPAAIGRDVRNCHPPQSVHVVNEIINSFREGKQDLATFWIDFKGRKIMIQFFALRDSKNNYRGVLEVSQDITEIRKLEGERRLLHWGK